MTESMTGFGRSETLINGYSIETEIRTVNNRYCDIFVKIPPEIQQFENSIRNLVQNGFERGKINVTLKVEYNGSETGGVKINQKLAADYYTMLSDLRNALSIDEKPGLGHLIQFPDIFKSKGLDLENEQETEALILKCVSNAIEKTIEMRRSEGQELANDMLERIKNIEEIIEQIKPLASQRTHEARTRLAERVDSILNDESYDKERLELEIVLLADKLDITEELVRLHSHVKYFREAIESDAHTGRKLNFLMQEMLREVNTIGSKAYHADIAHKVVEIKEIIEIIREQVQNIV